MASTVVGFFDTYEEAKKAVAELVANGYNSSGIDVSNNNTASLDTSDTSTDNDGQEQESGIAHFFKTLFGSDDDEANRYTHVGSKMGAMVTVHAQTSEEAEKAADLMDNFGAIDVDQKSSEYGYKSPGASFGNMDAGSDFAIVTEKVGSATTETTDSTNESTDFNNDEPIPDVQENNSITTQNNGGVRVRSKIVDRSIEENDRLRH